MKEYILFSAVGGHDPIANYHDGAILHISRVYKPKKVCLYLSKEMSQRSDYDNRYVNALERLQKKENFQIDDIELIKKEELVEVQLFDTFYREFEAIIEKLQKENPDYTVLLNVSSGTPAMKSAMEIISTLADTDIKAVQVSTPRKSENFKTELPEQYDNDVYWETNEDNNKIYENRCLELKSLNLLAKIKREMVIKLVDSYDYHAALTLAKEIENHINSEAIKMLQAAVYRSQLNQSEYDKLKVDFMPVKTGDKRTIVEYVLNLQVKQKQANYADFIRGLTPVIVDILEQCLMEKCGIDIKKYCDRSKNGIYKLSEEKMKADKKGREILAELTNALNGDLRGVVYSSAHIAPLIKAFSTDFDLIDNIEKLREVEKNVRNIAAHEIVSVNDDMIRRKTGVDSREIMEILKKVIIKSGFNVKKESWSSYEDMNQIIKKQLLTSITE